MNHQDLIVFRPHPDLAVGMGPGLFPPAMNGRWMDRNDIPEAATVPRGLRVCGCRHTLAQHAASNVAAGSGCFLLAYPTGRFEVREGDGAVAEIWEVCPCGSL